uniref:Uncharacterized protein n=1 Tax=Anopheles coluzzii TaxID=1518534 RepID=A0A8W7PXZ0_ANOCL
MELVQLQLTCILNYDRATKCFRPRAKKHRSEIDNQIGLRVGPPVRADYRDRLRPEQDLRPAALLQDGMGNGCRYGSATIARDRFRRRFQYERRLLAIIRHRNAIERVVLLDGWCYRHAPNHRSVGRRGPGSHHYHWVGGLCRA